MPLRFFNLFLDISIYSKFYNGYISSQLKISFSDKLSFLSLGKFNLFSYFIFFLYSLLCFVINLKIINIEV
jgi:hypothetical protein